MRIQKTSRQAYSELKPFLSGKRKAIFELFLQHKNGATRQEIARWYKQKECSVCGRVNELLNSGYLRVVGLKKDEVTGKTTQVLKAVKLIYEC